MHARAAGHARDGAHDSGVRHGSVDAEENAGAAAGARQLTL